jgi:UDP-2-acetamido-2-deoxy-ribo-hexuluronate aminotransferase
VPFQSVYSNHIFHQYTLRIKNNKRNDLKTHLHSKGIPSVIYYPVPLHLQKAFAFLGYERGDFPVSEEICETVISLPMHTELDEEQQGYISRSVIDFFKK